MTPGLEPPNETYVTVRSQINLIKLIAGFEIFVGIIVLLAQTVALASAHEFATRSLTGIWTSWFFLISAGVCLFWSSRCTFNGLLAVLVLQIISATMGIPLFTACCLIFGVYPFRWSVGPNGDGVALVGSSISILSTNLIMLLCSLIEIGLNSYNAYNCYFLAYGEAKEDQYYDENNEQGTSTNQKNSGRNNTNHKSANNLKGKKLTSQASTSSNRTGSGNTQSGKSAANSSKSGKKGQNSSGNNPHSSHNQSGEAGWEEDDWNTNSGGNNTNNYNSSSTNYNNYGDDDWGDSSGNQNQDNWGDNQNQTSNYNQNTSNHNQSSSYNKSKQTVKLDPGMPIPPPDLTLSTTDILIIKNCGVTGVLIAFIIFCSQAAIFGLVSQIGVNIGIGIWGALYYAATGIVTVYNALKPTPQSSVAIFILQTLQFVLSVPLVGISYYILAVFGSCLQYSPVPECPKDIAAGITVTCLGGIMAICGTIQILTSIILMLISSTAVCGIRCMVSGATVHPTL